MLVWIYPIDVSLRGGVVLSTSLPSFLVLTKVLFERAKSCASKVFIKTNKSICANVNCPRSAECALRPRPFGDLDVVWRMSTRGCPAGTAAAVGSRKRGAVAARAA